MAQLEAKRDEVHLTTDNNKNIVYVRTFTTKNEPLLDVAVNFEGSHIANATASLLKDGWDEVDESDWNNQTSLLPNVYVFIRTLAEVE